MNFLAQYVRDTFEFYMLIPTSVLFLISNYTCSQSGKFGLQAWSGDKLTATNKKKTNYTAEKNYGEQKLVLNLEGWT